MSKPLVGSTDVLNAMMDFITAGKKTKFYMTIVLKEMLISVMQEKQMAINSTVESVKKDTIFTWEIVLR